MKDSLKYNAVVFSGGGCRCFWQAGFYQILSERYNFFPKVLAGVSAGATMACIISSKRIQESLKFFMDITSKNKKNIYIHHFFTQNPLFPHYDIYSQVLNHMLDDQAFHIIKHGPDIRVLLAHPPRFLGSFSGAFLGFFAYTLEKMLFEPLHPSFPTQIGYRAKVVSIRSCPSKESLADLLLQSSCTPPIIPFLKRDGKPVYDGGLIDNVPERIINTSRQKILILLTRKYAKNKIPNVKGRTYVQPSKPIPIKKWDYTNPKGIKETFDLGRKDAENFIKNGNNL